MEQIQQIEEYIQQQMTGESTGHDFWHIRRVVNMAKRLQAEEGGDPAIIELTCLLHDIGDYKITGDPNTEYTIPKEVMEKFGIAVDIKEKVLQNISKLSFRGTHSVPDTLEGRIAQDADRLDAIGAIGAARTFYYGGSRGKEMWNPEIAPMAEFASAEQYINHRNSSLNHFDEKLFKLKDLMNTDTAKKIAEGRDAFLHEFYERFKKEWTGEL